MIGGLPVLDLKKGIILGTGNLYMELNNIGAEDNDKLGV